MFGKQAAWRHGASHWRMLPLPSTTPRPFWTPRFIVGSLLALLALMVWRALQHYPTGVFDFYPLYYGAKSWLATGNAYDLTAVIPPEQRDFQLYQIGNVYPFPAVLLVLPFGLLSPQVAGVLWIGLLGAGFLLALRLHDWPFWYLVYLPVIESVRIEQVTSAITISQIVALWAWRTRRPWLLAIAGAVALTKPNQGLFLVIALTLLAGNWWRQALVSGALLALSFALYPGWVLDWIPLLQNSHAVLRQPFLWPLALLAIPLVLCGDLIAASVVAQFVLLPYPGIYALSALPLSALGDRRSKWLILAAPLWIVAALLFGQPWAAALTMVAPVIALAWLRRVEHQATPRPAIARPVVTNLPAPLTAEKGLEPR